MASVLPPNSTVLVTGINGYIGSHIADQLMLAGYKVRGTTRSLPKGDYMKDLFTNRYGADKIEIAEVPDISVPGAFDEALKGVSGVAHVATENSKSAEASYEIPHSIGALTSILNSALNVPTLKRFVYTSSFIALALPKPGVPTTLTHETWNEESIRNAWAPPPWKEGTGWSTHGWSVYAASKAETEKALWKFRDDMKAKGGSFEISSVLPGTNFGPMLDMETHMGSTGGFIKKIWDGDFEKVKLVPSQLFVDVRDTARLHVAALTQPDVVGERIFAFSTPYDWNSVLAILRELAPDHEFPSDIENLEKDMSTINVGREETMLKRMGQKGFNSLRLCLEDCVATY